MKSVGRITIPGTLGYDLSFIREIITPTGRTIRFVTSRKIAFGESYWDTQTKSFNLTAGEININDKEKDKSGGVLFPAAQLIINKEGELQWELNQNAWKLVNIIEWD
jgi:predicted GTPase